MGSREWGCGSVVQNPRTDVDATFQDLHISGLWHESSVDLRVWFGSFPAGTNLCSYGFGLGAAAVGSFDL